MTRSKQRSSERATSPRRWTEGGRTAAAKQGTTKRGMGSSQVTQIVQGVGLLIQLLGFAIFARAILSWFPIDRSGPVVQALEAVTDPILQPLRRVIPPLGMIDITPMVAMIVLLVIGSALSNY